MRFRINGFSGFTLAGRSRLVNRRAAFERRNEMRTSMMLQQRLIRSVQRPAFWVLSVLAVVVAGVSFGTVNGGQPGPELGPVAATDLASLGVQACAFGEVTVVIFQLVSVIGFAFAQLASSQVWKQYGHRAYVGGMIGLGFTGVLCAVYGSDFALYAGLTMAVLFVLSVLDNVPVPGARGTPTS